VIAITAIHLAFIVNSKVVVLVQFDKEASQTRDYCGAKDAPQRAARPDFSLRQERLFRMTGKLHH
jgi:hypothetical protein